LKLLFKRKMYAIVWYHVKFCNILIIKFIPII